MGMELKPLAQQTIVITGATSGHGLSTAQMAARKGARVMLAARDEESLRLVRDEIRAEGGTAEYVVTDVTDQEQVDNLAQETIRRFDGFDTWVNNAGVGVYSKVLDLDMADHRQVFETNYWGLVHGSLAAVRHFKDKAGGGALVNVGSINGDMAGPLLSSYNASKHAVKGFTDSLRIELQSEQIPVSVTLIKPSAIGTPFPEHGRNNTGFRARLPEPIYAPEVTARAILDAAQNPRRSITVGGVGKLQVLGAAMLPSLFDKLAGGMSDALVDREEPVDEKEGNLYRSQGDGGKTEGRQHGRSFSTFTALNRHAGAALGVAAGLAAAGIWAASGAGRTTGRLAGAGLNGKRAA